MLTIKYFTAEWCGPCKMFGPIINKLQTDTGINIQKIDIDNNRDLTIQYGVMGVPTLIFERDGEIVYRKTGVTTYNELVTIIERS